MKMTATFSETAMRITSLTLFILLVALLLFANSDHSHAQQPGAGDQGGLIPVDIDADFGEVCSRAAIGSILFSSTDAPDQLIVQIVGNNCSDPVLAVTISNSENEVVYSHSFPALWASYDCWPVQSCVDWVFERAIGDMGERHGGELLPVEDALGHNGYHDVNVEAYSYAQENDRPLICYQSGKSGSTCVVFMIGKAVETHHTGS